MTLKLIPAAAALLALSACAVNPAARLRAGLVDAGLPPPLAGCMADHMVERLSLVQLRRLQSLGKLGKEDLGQMSIDRLIYQIRALRDPEILAVTTKAALSCAIMN